MSQIFDSSNRQAKQGYRKLGTHDLSSEERSILIRHFGPQQGLNEDSDRLVSFDSLVQNYDFLSKRGGSAYYAHPIVEIRTLTKSESWFFHHKGFVSPNFCVQLLYKVKGHVTRSHLNRSIYELIADNPDLRANYCPMPRRILKIIFKDRHPKIIYQNINRLSNESIQKSLDRLMQKDRLEGFDLLNEALFRITIFHTQDS